MYGNKNNIHCRHWYIGSTLRPVAVLVQGCCFAGFLRNSVSFPHFQDLKIYMKSFDILLVKKQIGGHDTRPCLCLNLSFFCPDLSSISAGPFAFVMHIFLPPLPPGPERMSSWHTQLCASFAPGAGTERVPGTHTAYNAIHNITNLLCVMQFTVTGWIDTLRVSEWEKRRSRYYKCYTHRPRASVGDELPNNAIGGSNGAERRIRNHIPRREPGHRGQWNLTAKSCQRRWQFAY